MLRDQLCPGSTLCCLAVLLLAAFSAQGVVNPSGWTIYNEETERTEAVGTWRVFENNSFRVYSDAGLSRVTSLYAELEAIRLAAGLVVQADAPQEARLVLAVLFNDKADFLRSSPSPDLSSFTLPVTDSFAVVLAPEHQLLGDTNYKHQYAHRVLPNHAANFPPWYMEGIAELVATMDIGDDSVTLGSPRREGWKSIAGLIDFEILIDKDLDAHSMPAYSEGVNVYAQLWLLMHFTLYGEDGIYVPALRRYLGLLQRGAESTNAFELAFGMPVNEYGVMAMEKYLGKIKTFQLTLDSTARDMGIAVRLPTDGEIERLLDALQPVATTPADTSVSEPVL